MIIKPDPAPVHDNSAYEKWLAARRAGFFLAPLSPLSGEKSLRRRDEDCEDVFDESGGIVARAGKKTCL